ncbi:MAG: hypothetical protein VZQ62_03915 [Methanosphaera sp.]|nr:hypothetical protein [Methanosphaera sp.]
MANTKSTKSTNTVSKKEVEQMRQQMEDMQKLIIQLTGKAFDQSQNVQYVNDSNRDVTLTSLTVGELNLSTEGYGQGEVYTFSHYGEQQTVPYEDLKKLIKNNKRFIEGGNVFINDEEVVKEQKLVNVYKKLLSYEQIEKIFSEDKGTFEKIYQSMTQNQKETLKGIIFDKLNKDEKSVDMNIVQILNDDMNIDIMNDYRNQKKLFEELKNENKQ